MNSTIQNTTTALSSPSAPTASPVSRLLKELCYRALSPTLEVATETELTGWEASCLERADELGKGLAERYTLFVGSHREGLLVANLLANRYGAGLSELQVFCRGTTWMSGQVERSEGPQRTLVILPLEPQFTEVERQCLKKALADSTADATSTAPGAPLLPIRTVSALSHWPWAATSR